LSQRSSPAPPKIRRALAVQIWPDALFTQAIRTRIFVGDATLQAVSIVGDEVVNLMADG
jgi:hypothetical protein